MSSNAFTRLGLDPDLFTWEELASCRAVEDRELFFDLYEGDVVAAMQVDQICLHCPVAKECFSKGVQGGEWGVWGGIYLVSGRIDKNRNSHKSPEIWKKLKEIHGAKAVKS